MGSRGIDGHLQADGRLTNAEIANYLGFSVSTANYHVGAILAKLGVSNRAEAAAIAVREQLVDEFDL